jgi:hypothetical protein
MLAGKDWKDFQSCLFTLGTSVSGHKLNPLISKLHQLSGRVQSSFVLKSWSLFKKDLPISSIFVCSFVYFCFCLYICTKKRLCCARIMNTYICMSHYSHPKLYDRRPCSNTFTPSIVAFGHLIIWSFWHFKKTMFQEMLLDAVRRCLTLLDASRR